MSNYIPIPKHAHLACDRNINTYPTFHYYDYSPSDLPDKKNCSCIFQSQENAEMLKQIRCAYIALYFHYRCFLDVWQKV